MTTEMINRMEGLILGQAVGDALGLPLEGLSPARSRKIFGNGPLRHRFILGRGQISDDTEHLCMTGQALLAYPRDPENFVRSLAWKLRWWLAGLPAGTGLATLRSILKLWLGFGPFRSGVFSAGNGPAMRSPVIGAYHHDDIHRMREYVRASTRLTHTDPKAEQGALAVALCAAGAVRMDNTSLDRIEILTSLRQELEDPELLGMLDILEDHLNTESSTEDLAHALGFKKGVSGYIYQTVPVVIFAFLRHTGDYRQTVESVISLGGDTDSTGAIAGALAGAAAGADGIPRDWVDGIMEWPRSVAWMRKLAQNLAASTGKEIMETRPGPVPLFWPGILPRNLLFMVIVLVHGFRRLFPPY